MAYRRFWVRCEKQTALPEIVVPDLVRKSSTMAGAGSENYPHGSG